MSDVTWAVLDPLIKLGCSATLFVLAWDFFKGLSR